MNSSSAGNSTSKRLSNSNNNSNGSDRLSELPDNILVHILSFLPLTDAVRTLAIRRFGSLWTLLPSLEFDIGHYDEFDDDESDVDGKCTLHFASFVTNVIYLHKKVPIQSFKLRVNNGFGDDDDDDCLNRLVFQQSKAWIRSVIDRQVNNLYLENDFCSGRPILPHCVFTSQFLVVLKLTGFRIDELSRVQMLSLTKLSLKRVEASNEALSKIILGSPSLQELDLHSVRGLDELRFTAPNIRKLSLCSYKLFRDCPHCKILLDCPNLKILDIFCTETLKQVVDVSSLREVSIGYCHTCNATKEYFNKFSNVEVFKYLRGRFLDSGQDILQTRWKCLHIKSMLHGDELLSICRVLRSSPLLEEFIVYTNSQHSESTCDKGMLSLELPSCMMQHLKTVKMCSYGIPCHGLLRLAEFLLSSSVILEKLVILPSKTQSTMVNELKFVKQLLSFPRSSTNARVIFGSETCETV